MALLALLRAFPESLHGVRDVVRHRSHSDLVGEARQHGLSALVHHALKQANVSLRDPWASALARDSMGMAGGTLRAKGLLFEALEILGSVGVDPILIKGYALGARLYPEPLLRPTSDVDVFIRPEEVEKASQVLVSRGFRPMEEAAEAYHREHHHHVTFGNPRGSIELHFRLMTGFDACLGGSAEQERAITHTLEGRSIRVLAPEDEALYLAAHAANHLFGRIAWLYDLKLLVRATRLDWRVIAERARNARLQGPVYLGFAIAQRALAADIPTDLASLFEVGLWHRRMVNAAFSDGQLEASVWLDRKWSAFALTAAMASSSLSRVRFAGHHTARGLRRRIAKQFPRHAPPSWIG